MKRLLYLLPLLFCFRTFAQSGSPLPIEDPNMDSYLQQRKPATLTIQLENLSDSAKQVDVKCTFVTFGPDFQVAKYYTLPSNGLLEITLEQNFPYQQIWVHVGDYLYAGLYVNTGLKVSIDVKRIKEKGRVYLMGDGVRYLGPDGEFNTTMSTYTLYKQTERNQLTSELDQLCQIRKTYAQTYFSAKTDSIWQALGRIDHEFIQQHPVYAWAINNETASGYYSTLCGAYWDDTIPYDLLAKINNHRPFFTSNDGVLFYNYLSFYQTGRLRGIERNIRVLDSLYLEPKADIVKTYLLAKMKDSIAHTYPEILKSMQTAWCKKLVVTEITQAEIRQKHIDSLYSSAKQLSDTGGFVGTPIVQLPFGANLYTLDSMKNMDDFIHNLQSKFPNKALLIDFWATWCAPCLVDLPVGKRLHEANKDLPIEYIYICTNSASNITLWKNKIADLQLPGMHIFLDDKLDMQLKVFLNKPGAGFPTYIVIDRKGKLRPNAIETMQSLDRDGLRNAMGLN